jgi:hypothetical protein
MSGDVRASIVRPPTLARGRGDVSTRLFAGNPEKELLSTEYSQFAANLAFALAHIGLATLLLSTASCAEAWIVQTAVVAFDCVHYAFSGYTLMHVSSFQLRCFDCPLHLA